jgi:uncharacterized membrane protein YukC
MLNRRAQYRFVEALGVALAITAALVIGYLEYVSFESVLLEAWALSSRAGRVSFVLNAVAIMVGLQ